MTAFNDDGRVAWGDLSAGEKAARTTQQTFNFGMIILGTVLTASVIVQENQSNSNIPHREGSHMLCILKYSLRKAKRAISIERSIR